MPFADTHAATLSIDHAGRLKVKGAPRGIQGTSTLLKELGLKSALAFKSFQGLMREVILVTIV